MHKDEYRTNTFKVRVGMSIGHHEHLGPHKPDMKKDERNITDADREDAKRRIEGSLAPDKAGAPTVAT